MGTKRDIMTQLYQEMMNAIPLNQANSAVTGPYMQGTPSPMGVHATPITQHVQHMQYPMMIPGPQQGMPLGNMLQPFFNGFATPGLEGLVAAEVARKFEELAKKHDEMVAEKVTQKIAELEKFAKNLTEETPRAQHSIDKEKLIQEKMLHLLGCEKLNARSRPLLPDPLQEGEPTRHDDAGVQLFNPDWTKPFAAAVNKEYIDRAVSLVLDEEGLPSSDREKFTKKAKTYFQTLKINYAASKGGNAKEKQDIKIVTDRRRRRKQAKATDLHKAFPAFREQYGHDATVRIENAVNTDYLSSEYTDDDALSSTSSCPSAKVLKVVGLNWRSRDLLRLHARLRQIRAEAPSIGGSAPVHQRRLVVGDQEGDAKSPPKSGKKVVYKSWISEGWKQRTGRKDFAEKEDDPKATILKLYMPVET
ncbi:hypothetical protein DXG01_005850 [Tephrocybe rancida]|nr:hypothetical protein DXG01_005850 [Tephrocybe rancida]